MLEGHVKAAALMTVRDGYARCRKPTVTAEFSLGSSGVRADLVVFAEISMGFEIKTAQDTLRRLPTQMKAYAQYFNYAVAIVAPCHVRNITTEHLHGASLWTYDEKAVFKVLRANEDANDVSDLALTDLLTQAERRAGDFRAAMQARYGETSQRFWSAVARRSIRTTDLPLLSRFSDDRARARQLACERDAWWSAWLAAQGSLERVLA